MMRKPTIVFFAAALLQVIANAHILPGINIDPWNKQYGNPKPAVLKELGATIVRIELKGTTTEGPMHTLSYYDPIIREYAAVGIETLLLLDYATLPGRPSLDAPNSAWAQYAALFANRTTEIATHYADIVSKFEIWNEPDLKPAPGYDPSYPSQYYGNLLKGAYDAIHHVIPHATVVMGGLASGDPQYVAAVRSASPGGRLAVDAIGLHPYGQRPFPNWPSPTWGFGVLTTLLDSYLAVESLPLWVTEIGTNDINVQGQFPAKAFEAVQLWSSTAPSRICTAVVWFCWSDGMVAPFGLVDEAGAPKPAYYSYQNATRSI